MELRLVFWETTGACNLKCVHCRAGSAEQRPPSELTTGQSVRLLDEIAAFARPVVVLSGGEPLIREDIFDLAAYGTSLGLRMVLATNGTTLSPSAALGLKEAVIQRVSVSVDGASASTHDAFRGVSGAFEGALRGIEFCKSVGIPVQINTTIARHNIGEIEQIMSFAVGIGACALHLFLLVPTGCGKELAESEMISADEYEQVLNWLYETSRTSPIQLKATCAPHYFRIAAQRAGAEKAHGDGHPFAAATKGCLAGSGICFVSATGDVFPCGYFPVSAGSVLETPLSTIWRDSRLFAELRDPALLSGKCGVCEFVRVCGGCRARAYAETGDYLAEEPRCSYTPRRGLGG